MDNDGEIITAIAKLFIYRRSEATYPLIAIGPSDLETDSATDINFTCRAFGEFFIPLQIFQC